MIFCAKHQGPVTRARSTEQAKIVEYFLFVYLREAERPGHHSSDAKSKSISDNSKMNKGVKQGVS